MKKNQQTKYDRNNNKEIFTKNMFHASILMQAGCQLKCFKKNGKFFYAHLDTSFFDKRSLANQFHQLSENLFNKQSIKMIMNQSVLSQIEQKYYKLKKELSILIREDKAKYYASRNKAMSAKSDYTDDFDDESIDESIDDSLDESVDDYIDDSVV